MSFNALARFGMRYAPFETSKQILTWTNVPKLVRCCCEHKFLHRKKAGDVPVLSQMIAEPHPEDIKAMIRKRGLTLQGLSMRLGYSRAAVDQALRRPWPAVQSGIASFLGVDPADLWPTRYEVDGSPKRRRIANDRKAKPDPHSSLRQNDRAA